MYIQNTCLFLWGKQLYSFQNRNDIIKLPLYRRLVTAWLWYHFRVIALTYNAYRFYTQQNYADKPWREVYVLELMIFHHSCLLEAYTLPINCSTCAHSKSNTNILISLEMSLLRYFKNFICFPNSTQAGQLNSYYPGSYLYIVVFQVIYTFT